MENALKNDKFYSDRTEFIKFHLELKRNQLQQNVANDDHKNIGNNLENDIEVMFHKFDQQNEEKRITFMVCNIYSISSYKPFMLKLFCFLFFLIGEIN